MNRPRIDLLAPPLSGHLHPILAIARALKDVYRVRVISTEAAQARIRAAGLEGVPVLEGAGDDIHTVANPDFIVGSHPARLDWQLSRMLVLLQRLKDEMQVLYQDPAQRPDLLIADFMMATAGFLATELGIPWWTSLPSPCVLETPDAPPAYLGGWMPRAGLLGRVRDALGRGCSRGFKRLMVWRYRKAMRRAGLSSLHRADGSEAIYSPDCILVLGMPELEFSRVWTPAAQVIGPMLYTPPSSHPAPDFLPGRAHVLVTLGTQLEWLKDKAAATVQQMAARLPEIEFHFSDGNSQGTTRQRTGNFTRVPFVDYERLLDRYAVIVHHGGSGILYYCLRAGRPALVCPVDYDQFDNAARLAHAGVARWIKRLDEMETALLDVLADQQMAQRCGEFARKLQERDSGEVLRQRVREFLGQHPPAHE